MLGVRVQVRAERKLVRVFHPSPQIRVHPRQQPRHRLQASARRRGVNVPLIGRMLERATENTEPEASPAPSSTTRVARDPGAQGKRRRALSIRQHQVDLQGRLSNPPHHFDRAVTLLASLMPRRNRPPIRRLGRQARRRLESSEVAALIRRRTAGATIAALASEFGIHPTTVIGHCQRAATRPRRDPSC